MRITYRDKDTKTYWQQRWDSTAIDDEMKNTNVYPLKYALKYLSKKKCKILEAGCGAGRILRYFHNKNYDIVGIDYIKSAIEKLRTLDSSLNITFGDITDLKFDDNTFDHILAFGLYHGLAENLDKAINETYRVLKKDGILCASFRADNIQNYINDFYFRAPKKIKQHSNMKFHKINLKKIELIKLFTKHNFKFLSIYPVINMPFFYRFKITRHKKHKVFNEQMARIEGYRLSMIGQFLQNILTKCFPEYFCNLYVIYLKK
tara:strand:+ start:3348 stop:4130 length:783 start_codon:yes stop_codon:yes gene_type:complete